MTRDIIWNRYQGGPFKVVLKQYIKLKETQKQDSYGTTSAGSATNSYGSLARRR